MDSLATVALPPLHLFTIITNATREAKAGARSNAVVDIIGKIIWVLFVKTIRGRPEFVGLLILADEFKATKN